MLGVATFLHLVMRWEWIDSFMLGSIVSQTGSVVIVHMAKKLEVYPLSAILLTLESTFTSIFNIVFFLVFLEIRLGGILDLAEAIRAIFTEFSIGIIMGGVMGVLWLLILLRLENVEFTYVAMMGYILISYVLSETLQGSGALAVLVLGAVLGNEKEIFRILRISPHGGDFSTTKTYLMRFQGEISFILRSFFFVLLGLIFDLSQSSLLNGLYYGLPIVGILLVVRYLVVTASTWKSPMTSDRGTIIGMCALGLTPALLSFILLQRNLPDAYSITLIVTNIIIFTNIITSITALKSKRNQTKSGKIQQNN